MSIHFQTHLGFRVTNHAWYQKTPLPSWIGQRPHPQGYASGEVWRWKSKDAHQHDPHGWYLRKARRASRKIRPKNLKKHGLPIPRPIFFIAWYRDAHWNLVMCTYIYLESSRVICFSWVTFCSGWMITPWTFKDLPGRGWPSIEINGNVLIGWWWSKSVPWKNWGENYQTSIHPIKKLVGFRVNMSTPD